MAPPAALALGGARALSRRRTRLGVKLLGVVLVVVSAMPVGLIGCVVLLAGDVGEASSSPTGTPAGMSADGVPRRAASAYQAAVASWCPALDWTLLAAVGEVESNHGQTSGASLDPDTGEATPWIFGPVLNGSGGTAAIPVGRWVGWWGLSGPWAQAVSPMQFLPPTFDSHAVDADHDDVANPHDIDDAAATAAAYICATTGTEAIGPQDIADIYNPGSVTYADELATAQQHITASMSRGTGATGVQGAIVCPVAGAVDFSDTWGAPRSGGRTHEGVDIFANQGTPVVAPESGTVEHYNNSLGGLSYRLYGDSGTYYYGTHLSAYENVGIGRIEAGTTIGYVGQSGNAAGTPPHLHWEIHPAGRGSPAVNPTPAAEALCR